VLTGCCKISRALFNHGSALTGIRAQPPTTIVRSFRPLLQWQISRLDKCATRGRHGLCFQTCFVLATDGKYHRAAERNRAGHGAAFSSYLCPVASDASQRAMVAKSKSQGGIIAIRLLPSVSS
jgi:hypothetical protein